MVSLENTWSYLAQYYNDTTNPILCILNLLQNNIIEKPTQNSTLSIKLVYSIQTNDFNFCEEDYTEFSGRKPTPNSSFIYDDITLFLLVCTCKKFNLDKDWILSFLNMRKGYDETTKKITQALFNILNDNLNNKEGASEIIICYNHIFNFPQDELFLNENYTNLTKKPFPFYEQQPLMNIFSIASINITILAKGLQDGYNYQRLEEFEGNFKKKSKLIAKILYFLIVICSFSFTIWNGYNLFLGDDIQVSLADRILTFFNLFSFSSISTIFFKKSRMYIMNLFQKPVKWFFGYKDK